jgi:hypothetical protein
VAELDAAGVKKFLTAAYPGGLAGDVEPQPGDRHELLRLLPPSGLDGGRLDGGD